MKTLSYLFVLVTDITYLKASFLRSNFSILQVPSDKIMPAWTPASLSVTNKQNCSIKNQMDLLKLVS